MATIEELLRDGVERLRASGSETPRLDAELLLARAIGTDRSGVLAYPEARVGDGQRATFEAELERRAAGEPVAYIRGFKEFYGLAFSTDARALIPRPETELIVELAEREVMDRLTARPAAGRRATASGSPTSGRAAARSRSRSRPRCASAGSAATSRSSRPTSRPTRCSSPARTRSATGSPTGCASSRPTCCRRSSRSPSTCSSPTCRTSRRPTIDDAAHRGLVRAAPRPRRRRRRAGRRSAASLERLPETVAPAATTFLEIGADQGDAVEALVAEQLPGWSCSVARDLAGLPRVARIERPPELQQPARA